ncbi:PREDICTED: uncharacterized protein LOC109341576, partial [Lupinus angustifolius]|uniref:uncharacterized protein LOC109341576 n=1 Tax=Lupinus angustifolius TaxID=3871 RepID=UPI00092E848C
MEVGEQKPTTISLQLAYRSVKFPICILEDVSIKVEKIFIPTDLVILEMDEGSQIPIILDSSCRVDMLNHVVKEKAARVQYKDPLERCMVDDDTSDADKEVAKVIEFLNTIPSLPHKPQDENLKVMPKSEDWEKGKTPKTP